MKANSTSTKSKAMGTIFGQTVVNMKVFGKITKCMEKAFLHGWMEEGMKVNIPLIKSKAVGYLPGQTGDHTMASGKTVNNKAKEFIGRKTEFSGRVFGRTARRFAGPVIQRLKREIDFLQTNDFLSNIFSNFISNNAATYKY